MLEPGSAPTLEQIRANREHLGDLVLTTPVRLLEGDAIAEAVGAGTRVWLKEEQFQRTGSFKPRGALSVMLSLDSDSLRRGVTGVSAGNHAISLAYSARILGTTAKVVMPETANPFRVQLCRDYGGEVEFVSNVHKAFARTKEIASTEGRTFVHPFEGPKTALGTASVGVELMEQVEAASDMLEAVVVAVGGGGLSAGVSCAVKQMRGACSVFGVEPEGADSLRRSFDVGAPSAIEAVTTIADSLGAPHCEPYSFGLNRRFVDDVVLVSDDQILAAMRLLFYAGKLVTEPAGAAALAGVMYPLRGRLEGKTVGVIVCGANIDAESFGRFILQT
jgi:threonine dehydratase